MLVPNSRPRRWWREHDVADVEMELLDQHALARLRGKTHRLVHV
jgi:hypothetical protein